MTERYSTVPPTRRGATSSSKRKFCETYDPSSEHFPNDPWHVLNHEIIIDQVRELCDELIIPLEQYATLDQAIANLIQKATVLQKLPDMKKLRVAVLGKQGAGKSTLVNALLDRKILDASASSSACTAFATSIEYKEGAADGTRVSDVKIEFLSDAELRLFVSDQVNRYADYHYPIQDDDEENEQYDETQEEEGNESDVSSSSQSQHQSQTLGSRAPGGRKRLKAAAKTAKEFFGIVFNVKEDLGKKQWLEHTLETNIRQGYK